MRLRPSARHTLPSSRHLSRLLGLAGCSTAAMGAVAALTLVGTPVAPDTRDVPLVPVAVEMGEPAVTAPAPVRASRARVLAGDDAAAAAADPLPGCAHDVAHNHPNGQLPPEALCQLPAEHGDHKLRPDAARGLMQLGRAYEDWFNEPFCFTDSYRSLGSQQALAARKPGLAAVPGTSEHGWGLAIDFGCGVEDYDTPQHRWMIANAGEFGWGQPDWAKNGGSREEPWHWEYLAAGAPSASHGDD